MRFGILAGSCMKGMTNWLPGNCRKLVFSCPRVTDLPRQDLKEYVVGLLYADSKAGLFLLTEMVGVVQFTAKVTGIFLSGPSTGYT